jgi:hypothetical protein
MLTLVQDPTAELFSVVRWLIEGEKFMAGEKACFRVRPMSSLVSDSEKEDSYFLCSFSTRPVLFGSFGSFSRLLSRTRQECHALVCVYGKQCVL